MKQIIKRKGQKQEFNPKKLRLSLFAACLNAHLSDEMGEIMADKVVIKVYDWLEKKEEDITTDELFKKASDELCKLNEAAAFMYFTHRDVS